MDRSEQTGRLALGGDWRQERATRVIIALSTTRTDGDIEGGGTGAHLPASGDLAIIEAVAR